MVKDAVTTGKVSICSLVVTLVLIATASGQDRALRHYLDPQVPSFRVDAEGFESNERDIKRLLDSAARELWRFFPDHKIEPFVVQRGKTGPIVWYKRNPKGEIVMKLDTGKTLWSQFAFQFSHEFCHILCGFDADYKGNLWFEEAVCEAASLFAMRRMAEAWRHDPPYKNWKNYGGRLRNYAQQRIDRHQKVEDRKELVALYRENRKALVKDPKLKVVHEPVALVLLQMFEEDPKRWESVRWLNSAPAPEGESLRVYFKKWYVAVPKRHRPFVAEVAALFRIRV